MHKVHKSHRQPEWNSRVLITHGGFNNEPPAHLFVNADWPPNTSLQETNILKIAPASSIKYWDDIFSHSKILAKSNSWVSCDLSAFVQIAPSVCLPFVLLSVQFIAARGPVMCTWKAGIYRMNRLWLTSWGEASLDFLLGFSGAVNDPSVCEKPPLEMYVVSVNMEHIRPNAWDSVACNFKKVHAIVGAVNL